MRYVKIKAKNYNEAIMKLKMEHGDDAIPISHKYVREGGLFNSKILAKELVELTAAIPERKTAMKKKPEAASTIDFTVRDNEVVKSAAPVQQRVFPRKTGHREAHQAGATARSRPLHSRGQGGGRPRFPAED